MSDYAKGLEGVIANESALSNVEGLKGELSYLGYDIDDLVEHCCFGEVTYLSPGEIDAHRIDVPGRERVRIPLQRLHQRCQ